MPNWENLSYNGKTFLQDLVHIIPELKESEGERMVKFIKNQLFNIKETITENYELDAKLTKAIAWLEKQGEQKPVDFSDLRTWKYIIDAILTEIGGIGQYLDNPFTEEVAKKLQKRFGNIEQNPADKVESKFKVGDWVMLDRPVLITKVEDMPYNTHQYWTSDGTWFGDTTKAKLWTIQDAKDGDVLACENGWTCIFKTLVNDETFSSYCFMDNTKWFCETGSEGHTLREEFVKAYNGKIHPATKEQRDTLIKVMADAGYTFDFEKKELKKIEKEIEIPFGAKDSELQEVTYYIPKGFHAEIDDDKIVIKKGDQKPTWSEGDEMMLESVLDKIGDLGTGEMCKEWLKSLRPQSHWRPSDEQVEALQTAIGIVGELTPTASLLKEIREQLKKLKG